MMIGVNNILSTWVTRVSVTTHYQLEVHGKDEYTYTDVDL